MFAQARVTHNILAMRWSKPDIPLVVMMINVKNRALFSTAMQKKKKIIKTWVVPENELELLLSTWGQAGGLLQYKYTEKKEH